MPPQPNILDATTEFTRLAELPEAVFDRYFDMDADQRADVRKLRRCLLAEEVHEYLDGEDADNLTEIADGLADIIVIAWGTLLTYFGEDAAVGICREVWSSNLSKVDGSLGPIVRREDGKLLKPEGWQPPDIIGVLKNHGFAWEDDKPSQVG